MINYAHRGASAYAPENTMSAFCLGLEMGANGIETDIQRSRDGVLVLHHDATLKRTAGLDRRVCDLDWEELRDLDTGSWKHSKYKGERLVRLEDFLYYFGGRPIRFALEINQPGIGREVLETALGFLPPGRFTLTSFDLDSLLDVAGTRPGIQLGFLTREYSLRMLLQFKAQGIREYCPEAATLDQESAQAVRSLGLGLRAWGVRDESLMLKMMQIGVDGMTVNFPDLLAARLRTTENTR